MENDEKTFRDILNEANRQLLKDGGKALEDLPVQIQIPQEDMPEGETDAD